MIVISLNTRKIIITPRIERVFHSRLNNYYFKYTHWLVNMIKIYLINIRKLGICFYSPKNPQKQLQLILCSYVWAILSKRYYTVILTIFKLTSINVFLKRYSMLDNPRCYLHVRNYLWILLIVTVPLPATKVYYSMQGKGTIKSSVKEKKITIKL